MCVGGQLQVGRGRGGRWTGGVGQISIRTGKNSNVSKNQPASARPQGRKGTSTGVSPANQAEGERGGTVWRGGQGTAGCESWDVQDLSSSGGGDRGPLLGGHHVCQAFQPFQPSVVSTF